MKPLPLSGNYALCIAHPGHEIRLHGFIEKTKPYIFVLADQGEPSRMIRLSNYLGFIFKNTKNKRDAFYVIEQKPDDKKPDPEKELKTYYLTDLNIQNELHKGNIDFFKYYVKQTANRFVQNKIDHVVVDSIENMDATHDINRALIDAAVALVKKKKGKQINIFEFNVSNPYDHNIGPDCLMVELEEEEMMKKISFTVSYSPDVFTELKQNLSVDISTINKIAEQANGFEEIKNLLLALNPGYFKYEYLRPATEHENSHNYKTYILPIREKLMQI